MHIFCKKKDKITGLKYCTLVDKKGFPQWCKWITMKHTYFIWKQASLKINHV